MPSELRQSLSRASGTPLGVVRGRLLDGQTRRGQRSSVHRVDGSITLRARAPTFSMEGVAPLPSSGAMPTRASPKCQPRWSGQLGYGITPKQHDAYEAATATGRARRRRPRY